MPVLLALLPCEPDVISNPHLGQPGRAAGLNHLSGVPIAEPRRHNSVEERTQDRVLSGVGD